MERDWKSINNRLVQQGTILVDLRFLEKRKAELASMNDGKQGAVHLSQQAQKARRVMQQSIQGFAFKKLKQTAFYHNFSLETPFCR